MTTKPSTSRPPIAARLYTLRNALDMRVTISERGAALVSWLAPDRYGRIADVLLGFAHAGAAPLFDGHPEGETSVSLQLDGCTVRYQLDDDGSLVIEVDGAVAYDGNVPPYFNLNGGATDVGDHMLQIDADQYIEIDQGGSPLSRANVGGSAFDFRQPAPIGPRLNWPDPQILRAGGFRHCYCVKSGAKAKPGALRQVARVVDPGSGRQLQVSTTESGLQFCSGSALDGVPGRRGQRHATHDGLCLESSSGPDLLAGAEAPSTRRTTVYRMGVQA
jgi:aldose 1-epimerase